MKEAQIGTPQNPVTFELSPRAVAETPAAGMQRNEWVTENFSSSESSREADHRDPVMEMTSVHMFLLLFDESNTVANRAAR